MFLTELKKIGVSEFYTICSSLHLYVDTCRDEVLHEVSCNMSWINLVHLAVTNVEGFITIMEVHALI